MKGEEVVFIEKSIVRGEFSKVWHILKRDHLFSNEKIEIVFKVEI